MDCVKVRPSSDSSSNSDRMSGHPNDVILMLHAPDGSRWSTFMSSRLESPPYEIRSISKDLTILEGPPEDDDDKANDEADGDGESEGELYLNTADIVSKRTGGDSNTDEDNNNNTRSLTADNKSRTSSEEVVAGAPSTDVTDAEGEKKDQTRLKTTSECSASVVQLTDSSSTADCILYSRACVIFLSPEIIEGERPFPIEISNLNPRNTLFLFLGVEIQEVRQFFGNQSDFVTKCRCSHIDGSEVSICDALLQVVHAYEDTGGNSSICGESDDEDGSGGGIYDTPTSVLQNGVENVFPRDLTGSDRLVYVLLKNRPEQEVIVKIDSNKEFPLTPVCDRLFSFTLPEGLSGKVSFVITSESYPIGSESVRILSRLDQLREILLEEGDPKTILAQAVGVSPGDEAGLDTALALRLQQLASARTFAAMFPEEEEIHRKGAAKQVMYPSLLHFAADYNLRTFCSELLKYPSMVGAAQAENKDGETAQQVAARKKFMQLESDLAQFAMQHGVPEAGAGACADEPCDDTDNMYVQPSQASPRPPPPPPHRTVKPGYVNNGVECYVAMGEIPKPGKSDLISLKHQLSHIEAATSGAGREFPGSTSFLNDDEYHNLDLYYRTDSGISHGSTLSSPRDRLDSPTSPDDSPRTSARKAYKVMGVTEDEVSRLQPTFKSRSFDSHDHLSSLMTGRKNSEPKNFGSHSLASAGANRDSCGSNGSDQFDPSEQISPKNSKGTKSRLKNFLFGKAKNKRSSSITEMESSEITAKLGGRGRRGSESSINTQRMETPEERDSGSYSDEEKEKPAVPVRRSSRSKAFKEREGLMARRLSRRAQAAINEKIDSAPTLPSRAGRRRRGAFKSFIED